MEVFYCGYAFFVLLGSTGCVAARKGGEVQIACLLVCKSLVYQEPTSDLMQITVRRLGFMKVGLDAVTE